MPSHVKPSKNLITRFEYFTVTSDSLTKTMFDRRDGKYEGWRGKGNEEGGRGVQKGGREGEPPLVVNLLISSCILHWNTGKISKVVEGMKEEFQSINFGWIGYGELVRVLVFPQNPIPNEFYFSLAYSLLPNFKSFHPSTLSLNKG